MTDPALIQEAHALAIYASRSAGAMLRGRLSDTRTITFKSAVDLVTDADQRAEAMILERIQTAFPDHYFLGEESTHVAGGYDVGAGGYAWIVDPLDGTTNYTHGYPHFAVSIALAHGNDVVIGVVYDPMRDELFDAIAGGGARLNGAPMSVSKTATLGHSLLATGFAYDPAARTETQRVWDSLMPVTRGVRRDGSAALDAVYVAAGRLDGFWERPINPWDIAAGALTVIEAGGIVTGYGGEAFDPFAHELSRLERSPSCGPSRPDQRHPGKRDCGIIAFRPVFIGSLNQFSRHCHG